MQVHQEYNHYNSFSVHVCSCRFQQWLQLVTSRNRNRVPHNAQLLLLQHYDERKYWQTHTPKKAESDGRWFSGWGPRPAFMSSSSKLCWSGDTVSWRTVKQRSHSNSTVLSCCWWKNRIYWYISFFHPFNQPFNSINSIIQTLNRVLFPMFYLPVEGECQILVF